MFDHWLTPKEQFRPGVASRLRNRSGVRQENAGLVSTGEFKPDISKYPKIEEKLNALRANGQHNEAAFALKTLEDWLAKSEVAPPWQQDELDSKDVAEMIDLAADEPDIIDIETVILEQLPSRIQVKTEAGSHTSASSDSKSHSNSHSKALSTNSLNGSHPASQPQSSVPSSISTNSPSNAQSSNLKSQSKQTAKKKKQAKSVRSELPLSNLELPSPASDSNSNSQLDFDSVASIPGNLALDMAPKPADERNPSSSASNQDKPMMMMSEPAANTSFVNGQLVNDYELLKRLFANRKHYGLSPFAPLFPWFTSKIVGNSQYFDELMDTDMDRDQFVSWLYSKLDLKPASCLPSSVRKTDSRHIRNHNYALRMLYDYYFAAFHVDSPVKLVRETVGFGLELRKATQVVNGQGFLSEYLRADLYRICEETYHWLKARGCTSIWVNSAGTDWFLKFGMLDFINETRDHSKMVLKLACDCKELWVTGNRNGPKTPLPAGSKLWLAIRSVRLLNQRLEEWNRVWLID